MGKAMRVLCAVLFCVTNGVAYAQGSPPPSPQPTPSPDQPKEQSTPSGAQSGELTAKNPLLFALVVQPLFERAGTSLSSGVGSLFGRLFKWVGFGSEADTTSPPAQAGTNFQGQVGSYAPAQAGTNFQGQVGSYAPAQAGSYAPAQEGTYFQGQVGTYAPAQAKLASKLVPSIIYTIEQVDPHTFETTSQLDLSHGAPTLYTGDTFAIRYSTNVSGQVRIDNIDSQGQKSALGTYTVLGGRDNRIPVKKGMQLVGNAGLETFKMYFFPCTPADNPASTNAVPQDAVPSCPSAPSERLVAVSRGLAAPKAAVNLDSPDPTIAISAVTNYQSEDVTENDFQIQHNVRQPAQ